MKEIIFYKLPSGKGPIEDFLDSLSSKEAQKAVWVLNLIEELETVSSKYYKKLVNTDDIIEVRVQIGKKHFRLLGFEDGGRFVVLTNGFKKKDQKVPKQEIKLAKQRKQDYLERRKDNEWFKKNIYKKEKLLIKSLQKILIKDIKSLKLEKY